LRILVTGGAGMIGSNLARRLRASGHDVLIVDNLWRGTIENVAWALGPSYETSFLNKDLSQLHSSYDEFREVDVVFHLADVVAGINYVFDNQYSLWARNIRINSNVLQAAIDAKVQKIIYVGTACSYPAHLTTNPTGFRRLIEADAYPANPESSYGWSKLMGEYEIELAEQAGLISAVILRLHNVYGFPAELSAERSQVIPALIRKAIQHPKEEFVVWGSGHQRRSFIFVDDVVDALVSSLSLSSSAGAIQIGPEESTSIEDLAHLVIKLSGKEIVPEFDLNRPEGDHDRVGDFSRARNLLGWEPKTSLEAGIEKTFDWAKSYLLDNDSE